MKNSLLENTPKNIIAQIKNKENINTFNLIIGVSKRVRQIAEKKKEEGMHINHSRILTEAIKELKENKYDIITKK